MESFDNKFEPIETYPNPNRFKLGQQQVCIEISSTKLVESSNFNVKSVQL